MKKKAKTNILFFISQMGVGGSEMVILELIRSLDTNKFQIFLASFTEGKLKNILTNECKKFFLIKKKRRFDIFAMIKLAQIIKEWDIDVINAHHYTPCFYSFLGTRVLNGKKLVYTEHSVPEVENIVARFHGKIFYWMLFRINAVIGVSQEITDKFKKYYPRHTKKFHKILNGVDIDKFKSKDSREAIRKFWGFSKTHFVVGMVANFRKVKNHVCLLRALARLKDAHPQLYLLFVGTGWNDDPENSESDVQELIRDLDLKERVVLTGYQENIPEILSALDAFCLPSYSEGLPVSILEAMAAGVPVVGSQVRGITEVVQHRKTGLLFKADDDRDLARQLEELIISSNLSSSLTKSGLYYVELYHDRKIWVEKTCEKLMDPNNKIY